ncbi:MAG TPA: zinc ribbon domain-containing protein [Gemmatimonadota bacterium]|nr:zinc ribbon domain-containing protein [Gemmatimonadota bacterium]
MSAVALGRLLVRRMEEEGGGSGEPLTVADVRSRLLPYRLCRSELDLATKAEYDLALLGLLSEPDLVEVENEELREAVARELSSAEPELDVLRGFDSTVVGLGPGLTGGKIGRGSRRRRSASAEGRERSAETAGAGRMSAEARPDASPRPDARSGPDTQSRPDAQQTPDAQQAPDAEAARSAAEDRCRSCGVSLPESREIRFCPHCGAEQGPMRCRACGEEIEPDWRYCPSCGRPVEPGAADR